MTTSQPPTLMQQHNDALHEVGLHDAGFTQECQHQSRLVAQADAKSNAVASETDHGIEGLLNSALTDVDGWTP